MRRFSSAVGLAALLVLTGVPGALGRTTEVGRTTEPARPSCPSNPCYVIARTTGYQAKVGSARAPYAVPRSGRIVGWSIKLARPTKKQIAFFNARLGRASAGITILRPGRRLYHRVVARSPVRRLDSYFGRTVQFPLAKSLRVEKGWVVALTVPTWAPALAIGFGNDFSWRASRSRAICDDRAPPQTAQTRVHDLAQYYCLYRTARLTYSAMLISTP
jgi:hypothetical protein